MTSSTSSAIFSRASKRAPAGRRDRIVLAYASAHRPLLADQVPGLLEAMENRLEGAGPEVVPVAAELPDDRESVPGLLRRMVEDVDPDEALAL
jgi:hypothetical protein